VTATLACAAVLVPAIAKAKPKAHHSSGGVKAAKLQKFVGVPQNLIGFDIDSGAPTMALMDESGKNMLYLFTPPPALAGVFDGEVLGQYQCTCYGVPAGTITVLGKTYPMFHLTSLEGFVGSAVLKDPTNGKPLANMPKAGTPIFAIAAQADGDDTGRFWQSDWVTSTVTLNAEGKGKKFDISDYDGKELIFGKKLAKAIGWEFSVNGSTPGVVSFVEHH
jgi:hypothetical protein